MTSPEPGAQSGTGGTGQGADPNTGQGTPETDPNNQTGQSADPGQGQQQPTDPARTVSQAEYDALLARMKAADQNRARFEAELKQLKEKDMPALEKANRDLTEMTARTEKAEGDLSQARLENAFLKDNKYKWKDPDAALKLADLSKVEVLEDGTVNGLTAALEALAKSKPYLLDEDKNEGEGTPPKGSTGAPAGQRQPNQQSDAKRLASRFPALRSRGVGA